MITAFFKTNRYKKMLAEAEGDVNSNPMIAALSKELAKPRSSKPKKISKKTGSEQPTTSSKPKVKTSADTKSKPKKQVYNKSKKNPESKSKPKNPESKVDTKPKPKNPESKVDTKPKPESANTKLKKKLQKQKDKIEKQQRKIRKNTTKPKKQVYNKTKKNPISSKNKLKSKPKKQVYNKTKSDDDFPDFKSDGPSNNPLIMRKRTKLKFKDSEIRKIIQNDVIEVVFKRRIHPVLNPKPWQVKPFRRMLATSNFKFVNSAPEFNFKAPKGIRKRTKAWYKKRKLIIVWDLVLRTWRMISLDDYDIVNVYKTGSKEGQDKFRKYYKSLMKRGRNKLKLLFNK